VTDATPRVVLVETEPNLPGLLPFQAWDALGTADRILLRDPDAHPSAWHLHFAGLDLERLAGAALERTDLDLTRPGGPEDRRLAKALVQRALAGGSTVYLLGPDDAGLPPVVGAAAQEDGVEVELVLLAQQPAGVELLRLVDVVRQLRDPRTGCPWDLKQTHESLVRYLVEETYELVDAIESGHDSDLAEELGDVLLQVALHAQIASDRRAFAIDEVARGIADKLVHRHPHVFADTEVADADEVAANWETLKRDEKGRDGPFEGVPEALPGLVLLETLQRKAAKRGFDWRGPAAPAERIRAELDELATAVTAGEDHERLEAELGDVLGAAVGLARTLGVDPDRAARTAARTFRTRFEVVLREAARREVDLDTLDDAGWLELWEAAKASGA
jgi:MazG family protein